MFTLTRRESSPIPLDVTGILPETVANLSALEVAKLPVLFGNRREELGQHFDVTAGRQFDLRFTGDTRNVHNIGKGMASGTTFCENDVGRHAGAQMSGGRLILDMGAGDWLGAEMRGGFIQAHDTVGDGVGAAYRGSRRGMTGGQIELLLHVGHEIGLLMRRGMIVVHGDTGEFAGASMIAGTIAVRGTLGARAGAGMKRGTILALGGVAEVSAGMRYSCEYSPAVLPLLGRTLNLPMPPRVRCFRGDVLTGGRGELLVADFAGGSGLEPEGARC